MNRILKRSICLFIVLFAFVAGIILYYTSLAVSGGEWATYPANKHIYSNGILIKAGKITDANGVVLSETKNNTRVYNKSLDIRKATVHAVGDLNGFVSTGMHSSYLKELCGYDPLNGVYNFSGEGNNIELTLDSNVCVTAYKALGSRAGTVGVYNYKTGEIVCMASSPTFDPASGENPSGKGVYVNRLLSGIYAPGSIFKLVTALSALENLPDAKSMKFNCSKGVTIAGEWLSCLGRHGDIGLDNALVHSCNAFFAQTALKLDRKTLTATAEKVGFNKTLSMDGIKCAESKYVVSQSNDIDFGWSGIGQHNDLVNPFQYLTFMGGIANNGESVKPYIVKKITSSSGGTIKKASVSETRLMSEENSAALTKMMRNNVKKNYGDWRFSGLEVCGKTGTAEVGDKSTPHSWFVGFCDNPDTPYAFTVIVENAGAGNGAATQIAATVLKKLK